ncbi:MAG TPA: hypothetical protein DHV51_04670 [Opitutae bacterium]|nr:hypothetical protein [Opitutae bacterium]
MQNAVKACFALRRLSHVRLCTLRQIVLAQSQALTAFFTGLDLLMHKKTNLIFLNIFDSTSKTGAVYF